MPDEQLGGKLLQGHACLRRTHRDTAPTPQRRRTVPFARVIRMAACAVGLALAGVPTGGVAAQVAPPNRTDLIPPDQRRDDRRTTLSIEADIERAPCVLDQPDYADIRFVVRGARFNGLEAVPGLSLDAVAAPFVGRELPISVLCDIRAEANNLLRSRGYLATVEIPEQNLSDGIPDFNVVFGRLTSIRVRGDAGPSERIAAAYLEQLTRGAVFNSGEAERYLLLADDLPGLDVRLSLRPAAGGAPGDLVGEIAVLRQRAMVDLTIQNLGSRALGRYGGVLRGEVYDLTGNGDRTSVALFSTLDFAEQQTVQIGHDFRVGSEGLRLGGTFTYSTADPTVGLPGFAVESETFVAGLFASYPILRSRRRSMFAETGFDLVNQDVMLNGIGLTEDRIRMIYARIAGETTDEQSILRTGGYSPFEPKLRARYSIEARHGVQVFGTSPDCRANLLGCLFEGAVPPSRIEADPTPLLVRMAAGVEVRPVPQWAFALETQAQITGDPLPAFEELAAGNFSIGRGYDPGAVLGDSGVLAAFEIRHGSRSPAGEDAVALQPYVFTDVAFVWNEDPSRRATNPDRLWSAGGGVRAVWARGLQGDLAIAVPLQRPDLAPSRGDVRVLFTLTARLLPWRF